MGVSERELAAFGGWVTRAMAGGTHRWGDPRFRLQECDVQADSTLLLPPHGRWTQTGVEYRVFNSGTGVLYVRDPDTGTLVVGVSAGVCALCTRGETWHGWTVSTPQGGATQPALQYELDITANQSALDVLGRVVALGYDGTVPAAVSVRVLNGVIIGTWDRNLRALTSGTTYGGVSWFAGSTLFVRVEAGAIIGGWGGNGGGSGTSGTGGSAGSAGEAAGQAIRTSIPLAIVCDGLILGGGGGGGGGGGSSTNVSQLPGGGGGGRGCNMAVGTTVLIGSRGGLGSGFGSQSGGGTGGPFQFGSGGTGEGGGGNGGRGGDAGASGVAGSAGTASGGAGGAGGAAISYLAAAGAPTILSGGSNVIGGTVSEAT